MMSQEQVKTWDFASCPVCGSTNLQKTLVTYKDVRKENVPVCNGCGHFMFAETTYSYAFTIRGVVHDWANAADLKGVIEDILRTHMPPDDVKDMEVNVMATASHNGDEEILL